MNRMSLISTLILSLLAVYVEASWGHALNSQQSELLTQLREEALVIDGHNDLPWALRKASDMSLTKYDLSKEQKNFHTDLPRLKRGGVGAQFWSAYVPVSTMESGTAAKITREQIDLVHRLVKKYPSYLEMALSADDIVRIRAQGKIASLIGLEGGHSIENSLEILREMYTLGARYMTLSHSKNLSWIEASTDSPLATSLNDFGKSVVAEMNKLGMFVDISHISARAMRAVLAVANAPVIASHSSAYALKAHVRNVPDDVLRLVATNGGVVMVNFYTEFVAREGHTRPLAELTLPLRMHECTEGDVRHWLRDGRAPKANVQTVVDHIEHIAKVAGIEHVGLGSDFDGVPSLPDGLEDVSRFPAIVEELLKRGYDKASIRKILGDNLLRAFRKVEEYSRKEDKI